MVKFAFVQLCNLCLVHNFQIFCFDFSELTEVAEFVEKHGTKVLRDRDEWGYTPAHWAALDGNVEIMRFIIDRAAPIDLPCLGTQGPRPIHWACRKGE